MNASDIDQWLVDAIVSPSAPVVFFAGAGVSVPSGLADFVRFSEHLITTTTGDVLLSGEIHMLARQLRPEVLLQAVMQEHQDAVLDFFDWLDGGGPNPNHYFRPSPFAPATACLPRTSID